MKKSTKALFSLLLVFLLGIYSTEASSEESSETNSVRSGVGITFKEEKEHFDESTNGNNSNAENKQIPKTGEMRSNAFLSLGFFTVGISMCFFISKTKKDLSKWIIKRKNK
ncbi:LPXTG cell wall anchor domain-containing protein [Enterococcus faecalis]